MSSESSIGRGQEYGFGSTRWSGLKTLGQLNGDRRRYRNLVVDVVDLRSQKKIGRMVLGTALIKFN
ncbi:MAG: hypothetical protein M0Q91_18790 [Methanoregula sp.]|nr:hypothetical protein [Methanoregula sp.]